MFDGALIEEWAGKGQYRITLGIQSRFKDEEAETDILKKDWLGHFLLMTLTCTNRPVQVLQYSNISITNRSSRYPTSTNITLGICTHVGNNDN